MYTVHMCVFCFLFSVHIFLIFVFVEFVVCLLFGRGSCVCVVLLCLPFGDVCVCVVRFGSGF